MMKKMLKNYTIDKKAAEFMYLTKIAANKRTVYFWKGIEITNNLWSK